MMSMFNLELMLCPALGRSMVLASTLGAVAWLIPVFINNIDVVFVLWAIIGSVFWFVLVLMPGLSKESRIPINVEHLSERYDMPMPMSISISMTIPVRISGMVILLWFIWEKLS